MKTSKRLDGIGEYYFSQKLKEIDELNRSGSPVINLGIGSPDMPPHENVIRSLQEESAKNNTHSYQSYRGAPALRNAISAWYRKWYEVELDPETEILPLIGSKEGILHICMTYLDKGDEVLVPDPGYPAYRSAVMLAGGKSRAYKLTERNNYMPDLAALEKKNLKKTRLMFVNYPHMPTGQLPTWELFEQLVAFAKKHDIIIIHDNPYSFILNDSPMSLLRVKDSIGHVIELNSLSKSHNMAGWRVGMLCGKAETINDILRFKTNMDSGMFLPVQLAAAKALSLGKDWFDGLNAVYRQRREKVFSLLHFLDCSFSKDQVGLFAWARVPAKYKDGFQLSDAVLKQARVFITPGGIFGKSGKKYVRVSLCNTEEKLDEAIRRLQGFLGE